MIVDQELSPGDRLPAERQLSLQLDVSRATIREALHELELKGLVERTQGRGTSVADLSRGFLASEALLSCLSPEERRLAELMDFREAIEPSIASRAARYATKSDIQKMEEIVHDMSKTRSKERYGRLDAHFHYLVARATHNQLITELVEVSSERQRLARSNELLSSQRRKRSLKGHKRILAAIKERDPERAHREMQRHLKAVAEELHLRRVDNRSSGSQVEPKDGGNELCNTW